MKKLIPLLFLAVIVVFSSCEKRLIMKPFTIQVKFADSDPTFWAAENAAYLNGSESAMTDELVGALEQELDHGKMELVESKSDFSVFIKDLKTTEQTTRKTDHEGTSYDLYELTTEVTLTVVNNENEEIEEMTIESSSGQGLSCDEDGTVRVTEFGGLEGAYEKVARKSRRAIKSMVKRLQK